MRANAICFEWRVDQNKGQLSHGRVDKGRAARTFNELTAPERRDDVLVGWVFWRLNFTTSSKMALSPLAFIVACIAYRKEKMNYTYQTK